MVSLLEELRATTAPDELVGMLLAEADLLLNEQFIKAGRDFLSAPRTDRLEYLPKALLLSRALIELSGALGEMGDTDNSPAQYRGQVFTSQMSASEHGEVASILARVEELAGPESELSKVDFVLGVALQEITI